MQPTGLANEPARLSALSVEEQWSGAGRIVHAIRHIPSELPTPVTVLGEFRSLPREGHGDPFANLQSDFATVVAMQVGRLKLADLAMRNGNMTPGRAQVKVCVWIDQGMTQVTGSESHNTAAIHESVMKIILDRCRKVTNHADITSDERDLDATARFVRINIERMNVTDGFDKGSLLSYNA